MDEGLVALDFLSWIFCRCPTREMEIDDSFIRLSYTEAEACRGRNQCPTPILRRRPGGSLYSLRLGQIAGAPRTLHLKSKWVEVASTSLMEPPHSH